MPTIQTILQPTDFTDVSLYAFQTACSLAAIHKAKLVVLYCMPASVAFTSREPPPDPSRPAELQDRWRAQFAWPQPADPSIQVDYRLAEGEPVDEILRMADAIHCDLIVVGTHGPTALERMLIGSVATDIMRRSVCPVLVVKAPPASAPAVKLALQGFPAPAEIVDVRPLGPALLTAKTTTLAHHPGLEIVRLILPTGRRVADEPAAGELIVHCLEGRVAFVACGKTRVLEPGFFVYLPRKELYSMEAIGHASLLMITFRQTG